ncbi:B-box zinc finger protein 22-like [Iris pallida]|uniref:B-box zinc finger protein 22-like n=1 Tax=Iris pallida TaxID=29817 RepID=A0AAX6IHP4_IRIPA|nr:B-box zinc finger protein 22-like [Iris pallida]
MKIQCNVCGAAEAKVLCCADDAALCWDCDEKVHAANRVAGKHHRVQLLPASRVPKCDICQEASGYFFCLEDRALLCRSCDVAIHTNNPYVSAHRRFLISGVQVGLEHAEPVPSAAKEQSNSVVESLANGSSSLPFSGESNNEGYSDQAINNGYAGGSMGGNLPDWPLDDLFGFTDYNQNYGSPKVKQLIYLHHIFFGNDICAVCVSTPTCHPPIGPPCTTSGPHRNFSYPPPVERQHVARGPGLRSKRTDNIALLFFSWEDAIFYLVFGPQSCVPEFRGVDTEACKGPIGGDKLAQTQPRPSSAVKK